METPKLCTDPEHQPRYTTPAVGRVYCPVCDADVPSPRPGGPRHESVTIVERLPLKER